MKIGNKFSISKETFKSSLLQFIKTLIMTGITLTVILFTVSLVVLYLSHLAYNQMRWEPLIIGSVLALCMFEVARHHPGFPMILELLIGPYRFREKHTARVKILKKISYHGKSVDKLLYANWSWPYGGVWTTGEYAILVKIPSINSTHSEETCIRVSQKALDTLQVDDVLPVQYQLARYSKQVLAKIIR